MKVPALLTALAPLLVASLALGLREALRTAPGAAPAAGVGEPLPDPPALLAALPTAGAWRVVGGESRLGLRDGRGPQGDEPLGAAELRGDVTLGPDGQLADLDVEALLDPKRAHALLGPIGEGRIALRTVAAPSVPGVVPASRWARPEAWLSIDGRRRNLNLRAAWMPIGPGRLRLALEAAWEGDVHGELGALDRMLGDAPRSTLALDLVLTRS